MQRLSRNILILAVLLTALYLGHHYIVRQDLIVPTINSNEVQIQSMYNETPKQAPPPINQGASVGPNNLTSNPTEHPKHELDRDTVLSHSKTSSHVSTEVESHEGEVPPQTLLANLEKGALIEVTQPYEVKRGLERQMYINGTKSVGQFNFAPDPYWEPFRIPPMDKSVYCELVTKKPMEKSQILQPGDLIEITDTRVHLYNESKDWEDNREDIYLVFSKHPYLHSMKCNGPNQGENKINVADLGHAFGGWFRVKFPQQNQE